MNNLRGIIAKALLGIIYIAIFIWSSCTGKGYLLFIDNKAREGVYTFSIKIDKATSVTVPAGSVKSVYVKGTGDHHIIITKSGTAIFDGTVSYPKGTLAAMINAIMIDDVRTAGNKIIPAQRVSETMYEEPQKTDAGTEQETTSDAVPVNP